MRMWNVPTKFLCRQHLLGEHNEVHSLIGCIKKGTSLKGYIDKGLVEVHNIKKRHDALVEEMGRRGYNHLSPLPEFTCQETGYVNVEQNIEELRRRCKECRERITKYDSN
jgi:hypothetical protein